jgi:lactoylglutathione lyase
MDENKFLQGNFKGLQHLGIPVSDLKISVEFYSRLGFKRILSTEVVFPDENDREYVAMMEQNQVIIELYQLTKKNQPELKNRRDGHVDHIAFDVGDVDKAFADLKKGGFEMIQDKPVFLNFWNRGCKYFAIRGPDGEKLEFNQIL